MSDEELVNIADIGGDEHDVPELTDNSDDIMSDLRSVQERLAQETEPVEEPVEAVEEPADETDDSAIPNYLEKWDEVLTEYAQRDLSHEEKQGFIDNLVATRIQLESNPLETLLQIAENFVSKEQYPDLIAALSHTSGIDPLDVDPGEWASKQPDPQVASLQKQIQQLQAQNMKTQISTLKETGKYPLLDDKNVSREVAKALGKFSDMGIEEAYRYVVSLDPDLSSKHAEAVNGKSSTRRKANAKDLPKGRPSKQEEHVEWDTWEQSLIHNAKQMGIM